MILAASPFGSLVFGVWKTNRPFDGKHYDWAGTAAEPPAPIPAEGAVAPENPAPSAPIPAEGVVAAEDKKAAAVGRKRDLPAGKAVTTANSTVRSESARVNPAPPDLSADPPDLSSCS